MAAPFVHPEETEYNVRPTPRQITVDRFTVDEIQNSWPQLQTRGILPLLVLPKKSCSAMAETKHFRNQSENLLISGFPYSMDTSET